MADDGLRTRLAMYRYCRAFTVLVLVPSGTLCVLIHSHGPFTLANCTLDWLWAIALGHLYRGAVRKLEEEDDD